jgi:hypothetical protein
MTLIFVNFANNYRYKQIWRNPFYGRSRCLFWHSIGDLSTISCFQFKGILLSFRAVRDLAKCEALVTLILIKTIILARETALGKGWSRGKL